MSLRPGNAGANTTVDHVEVLTAGVAQIPAPAAARGVRNGGDVAELTGLLNLSRWPAGMQCRSQ